MSEKPNGFETDRLRLRAFTSDDELLLIDLDSDPEVMRLITGGRPSSARHRTRVLSSDGYWAVEAKATGEFVGWVGLRPDGQLGYRFRRSVWGNGYATEAAQALIERSEQPRIFAHTYEHNGASRRVLEKLGMTLSRRYRFEGPEAWEGDEVEYELLRVTAQSS